MDTKPSASPEALVREVLGSLLASKPSALVEAARKHTGLSSEDGECGFSFAEDLDEWQREVEKLNVPPGYVLVWSQLSSPKEQQMSLSASFFLATLAKALREQGKDSDAACIESQASTLPEVPLQPAPNRLERGEVRIEPRLSIITLGVADLERSVAFYRDGLGFPSAYKPGDGIAFFKTAGTRLALYPLHKLAEDISHDTRPPARPGFSGVTLAHNVRNKEDVAWILALAAQCGGQILKPAQDVFWGGHSGYFADPDGHPWEVAWGPMFSFDEQGTLLI